MKIDIQSFTGRPKTAMAGDSLVWGSGQLRYFKTVLWRLSASKVLLGPVFDIINLFMVFTPISARQLECE